jgi:predicted dehydrogenase
MEVTSNKKFKFIIVGSGWRALHYVRIAKALPQHFELCALLCRTEEKAERFSKQYSIHATISIEECIAMKPDFVVVSVNKPSIASVSIEWMQRGFPVLCETPVAQTEEEAIQIRRLLESGCKLTVAEQYTRYPLNRALLKVIEKGFIGEPEYAVVSIAHEYHGASLIRAFLGIGPHVGYDVSGKEFTFATTETKNRYETFTDGRIAMKKRALALFTFENGKVAVYDFDSEQYHSTIRGNMLKVQGKRGEIQGRRGEIRELRGEILGDTVRYLDEANEPHLEHLEVDSRVVHRESDNPNMREIREIVRIMFNGEVVYEPPFGLCGLSEDETAMATLMWQAGEYVIGEGENPYGFEEAFLDVKMGNFE